MNLNDWQEFFGETDTVAVAYFDGHEQAGRHFIREHAAEAVELDPPVLVRWRGQWYAHRVEFPKFAFAVAQRAARRAVQRAKASDVAQAVVA
jgi:hypothetical protein